MCGTAGRHNRVGGREPTGSACGSVAVHQY